jgi:hypothetical protein
MKTSVLIILTVTVLVVGSALAVMNNACKTAFEYDSEPRGGIELRHSAGDC